MKGRRRAFVGLGSIALALALVCIPVVAGAAPARVNLGTAESFAVLAGSTVTNTGPTVVDGDLGVHPGNSVTGFPPGTVNGTIHAGDAVAAQAQSDLTAAYNDAAGRPCDTNLTGQDLGGLTLVAGVYCFDSAAQLTGTLTLNAQGDPDAVFIFQIGSMLTTASGSNVALINGANPCNIFWKVGSSATLGTSSRFQGSILALTSITMNTNATVDGRVLARNGAVTLDSNRIRQSCAAVQPSPSPTGGSPSPSPTGGSPSPSPSPSPPGGTASPSPPGGTASPPPPGGTASPPPPGGTPPPPPGGTPPPPPGGTPPPPPGGTPSPSALPSPPPGPNGEGPGTLGAGISGPSEVPVTGVPSWTGPALVAAVILIVTGLRLQFPVAGVNPRLRLVLDRLMGGRKRGRPRRFGF